MIRKLTTLIHEHYEQGSDEWRAARCGKITASKFSDVMTSPQSKADKEAGKLSKTADTYLNQLIGEIITGIPVDLPDLRALRWGNDHEHMAREVYEARTGNKVKLVGFMELAGMDIGCSPDGIVGDDGVVEIKCPQVTANHVKYLRNPVLPKEYLWQTVGEMFVSGRKWVDFVSFDPRVPTKNIDQAIVIIRIERDDKQMDDLQKKLWAFQEKLNEFKEQS